jgi:hypothetical protein
MEVIGHSSPIPLAALGARKMVFGVITREPNTAFAFQSSTDTGSGQ